MTARIHRDYPGVRDGQNALRPKRVPVEKQISAGHKGFDGAELASHLHADAVHQGERLSVVLYNDWGAAHFAPGVTGAKTWVHLNLDLPPSKRARTLTMRLAMDESLATLPQIIPVRAKAKRLE